jgi:hypothetical protein
MICLCTQTLCISSNYTPRGCVCVRAYQNIGDKLPEVAMAHDASRVVENCIKYGSAAQRETIHAALTTHYLALCQNHYAYHVVEKLLKYGGEDTHATIFGELVGHFKHISQHRDGHHVLELLYSNEGMLSSEQRQLLLSEFLGPQFRIYKDEHNLPHTLATIHSAGILQRFVGVYSICSYLTRSLVSWSGCVYCPTESEAKQDAAMGNVRAYIDKMFSKELSRSGVV